MGSPHLAVEDQARSVLHLLLDPGANVEQPDNPVEDCYLCPNCGSRTESLTSPYCSQSCRGQAAFVRQFRGALASGSIFEAEKQTLFGERLWWLLGGGLPLRESRILESGKRQVTKRSGGRCEYCDSPMTAVENIGSGCNRPLHLRAVCANCSKTKPYGDHEFSRSSEVVSLLAGLRPRICAITALKPCDDPVAWDWRAFVAHRRL